MMDSTRWTEAQIQFDRILYSMLSRSQHAYDMRKVP
jgi:hypothetical protein